MVLAAGLGLALAGFGAGAAPKADVSEIGRLITVSGERVELDAAVRFSATEASADYGGWYADFAVTFDRRIAEGGIVLYGCVGEWVEFPAMEYDGTVLLLASMGAGQFVTYAKLLEMKEFPCGVKLLDKSLNGTQVDIELRLTDPTDSGNFVTIANYSRKLTLPKTPNWFDANISQYVQWPKDAALATGGAWRSGEPLEDVAAVKEAGVLSIDADALEFVADRSRTLGQSADRVFFSADMDFGVNEQDALPNVDPEWKGGVIRVKETEGEAYYGLAKEGDVNVWKKLDGPAPTGGTVNFTMTIRRKAGQPVANYTINGVTYTLNGTKNIPVAVSGAVTGVSLGGTGTLTSLSAATEKAMVINVK